MNIEAALAYANKHELHALLLWAERSVLFERYGRGREASAHALYSGTKSFWGIAALEAQRDGFLDLDDRASRLIPEFASDSRGEITLRMLLQMTAGYGFGGLGNAVPSYERALAIPLKHEPGSTFTYGGVPLQVFGAYFTRALATHNCTPQEYLRRRVLQPAGVKVASWRNLADGTNPFPTGAQLTARDWLAYGSYVMEHHASYAQAFTGSTINPRYGLCWWLGAPPAPPDLFYASGAGGQALYIIPSRETVVVHFGASASYKHESFLKRLFTA